MADPLSDLDLLPRRFELHAEHMRTKLDIIEGKLASWFERIELKLTDMDKRISQLETEREAVVKRVAALERSARRRIAR